MTCTLPLPPPASASLLDLPAPAKVNLFLHVVGHRDDGYHLLQSVFALVDWMDRVHLHLSPSGISREDLNADRALPEQDLMVRAAMALQSATGCTQGVHIQLAKHIPMEAGLGGGSSDAATCLIGLNQLWGLGLSRKQLTHIGQQLGADVPFFIGGRNAWVEGVGEKLTPLGLPPTHITIVKPPLGVSTAQIFTSERLKRDTIPATIADFAEHRIAGSTDWHPYSFGKNDLQAPAIEAYPKIQAVINWLEQKNLAARMTGSGSAVFAVHPEYPDVSDAPSDWTVHQGCVLDVHPLVDWVV